MLELVRLTEPGPFAARTHRLGRYIGLRRGGKLVAMAGERMRLDGFTEISAVCTHPDARGQGLGASSAPIVPCRSCTSSPTTPRRSRSTSGSASHCAASCA
jgi:hypothetical protein